MGEGEQRGVTAIILNWETPYIALRSMERLLDEGIPVIFVENGSKDKNNWLFNSKYEAERYQNVLFYSFEENVGSSISRNRAIELVKTKYFFLIDGDILYVPGSIEALEHTASQLPELGCIGVHNPDRLAEYHYNGTPVEGEADTSFDDRKVEEVNIGMDWPMAWSQYGLFLKTDQRFPEQYPFDRPGHGFEDDWYYCEMRLRGLHSYFMDQPLYYHEMHSSWKALAVRGLSLMNAERRQALLDRFEGVVIPGGGTEVLKDRMEQGEAG